MAGNFIWAAGAEAIAEALRVNPALTDMHLGRNCIGDAGAQAIAEALRENWALKRLDLFYNAIKARGAKTIAKALRENSALKDLNLRGNFIGWKLWSPIDNTLAENYEARIAARLVALLVVPQVDLPWPALREIQLWLVTPHAVPSLELRGVVAAAPSDISSNATLRPPRSLRRRNRRVKSPKKGRWRRPSLLGLGGR